MNSEEVRRANFPQALRGYDRDAVHAMLDRVADWMEAKGSTVAAAAPGLRDEFAKVGERTTSILNAAEDTARELRDEAADYAERLRSEAEDESRTARLNASQKMDEMVAEAEKRAQSIVDEALQRRRQLNQAISSLIDRRDEIASEAVKLGEELLDAVDAIRAADVPPEDEEADSPLGEEPESEELEVTLTAEEEDSFEDPLAEGDFTEEEPDDALAEDEEIEMTVLPDDDGEFEVTRGTIADEATEEVDMERELDSSESEDETQIHDSEPDRD